MKKSQRARLAELTQKADASRSAEEKADFATLSALAVANPDAAKDTDDAAPSSAAPVAAPAAPTLKGFLASLKGNAAVGAELVAARASLAQRDAALTTITGERDTARADLTTAKATIVSLEARLTAFGAFFGLTSADLMEKGKDAAAVTALITGKISDQAAEQVAAIGLPQSELPKPTKGDGTDSFAEKLAAFSAMPAGKAKDEFYAKEISPAFNSRN